MRASARVLILNAMYSNTQEKFIWSVMAKSTTFLGWKLAKTANLIGKERAIIADDFAWILFPSTQKPNLRQLPTLSGNVSMDTDL